MLVLLSDLHFTDASTGDLNVRSSAFRIWIDDLCYSAKRQEAKELCLVFLGDIFDLIRTEAWLDEQEIDRPWGCAELLENPTLLTARCREVAANIARHVAEHNRNAFDVISGRDPEVARALDSLQIPIRRVYLPGNHDRLYRLVPEVRQIIDEAIGIETTGEPLHCVHEPDYQLIARHGHEFDVWNFERAQLEDWRTAALPEFEDYLRTPIGDPITTELVARLPRVVREGLKNRSFSDDVVKQIVSRVQEIEHVRPLHACVSWVYQAIESLKENDHPYEREEWASAIAVVEASLRRVYEDFMQLGYVKAWLEKHDSFWSLFDDSDRLEAIAAFLRSGASLNLLQELMALGERIGMNDGISLLAKSAMVDPGLSDQTHYVAYGHSHVFVQRALSIRNGQENVYFNSGTWRPRFVQADNHKDFVSWKEMSYLLFYSSEEDLVKGNEKRDKGVSFETWSGTKLKAQRGVSET